MEMMPAASEFAKRLAKETEKQPGWLYLLICTQLLVGYFGAPQHLAIGRWKATLPKLSPELWVAILTYAAYKIGDALDKITFKKRGATGEWNVQRYQPLHFEEARIRTRGLLEIEDGSYSVSLKILEAAHEGRLSVHFINESAKFVRSLLVPGYLATIILAFAWPIGFGFLLLAASSAVFYALAYYVYPRLKTWHITNLYRAIPTIIAEDKNREPDKRKLFIQDFEDCRAFLWDGVELAIARKTKKKKDALNTNAQLSAEQCPTQDDQRGSKHTLITILGSTFVLAILLIAALRKATSGVPLEVAKALLQVGVVSIAGPIVSWATTDYQSKQDRLEKKRDQRQRRQSKKRDLERQQSEYRDELLAGTLSRVVAAYAHTKRARRLLRARAGAVNGGPGLVQLEDYDRFLAVVNDAQLELEALKGDVNTSRVAFSDSHSVASLLGSMEEYLGKVVKEYERERHTVKHSKGVLVAKLKMLSDFLAHSGNQNLFKLRVVDSYHNIQRIIRADLLHSKLPDGGHLLSDRAIS